MEPGTAVSILVTEKFGGPNSGCQIYFLALFQKLLILQKIFLHLKVKNVKGIKISIHRVT